MQLRAITVSKELQTLSIQEASLIRRKRLSEATENQLKELTQYSTNSTERPIWKGVGKMFLSIPLNQQLDAMKNERLEYQEQLKAFEKKRLYLDTTYKNVINALDELNVSN